MASYLDVHIERKDFAHNGVFETVLNDINTHIQEGSTATFFGPSGCGKSTLFRIIAGLDQDFHGRVLLDGTDVTKPSARIGLVTQIDSAYDWCNVAKNIGFSLRYQPHFKAAGLLAHTFGLSDWELARAEIVRIASLVGLHETDLTKYPAQLSGGMRQRMNLGRALAARPDILLLDEPFSALDHESRESLQQLVLKLRDDTRTTLLIVTHDPEEALFLGDQVIVLGSRPGSVHTILEGADPGGSDPNVKYTQEFLETTARATDMAEQRIESQLSSLRKLITPISSQETFASELCGLPCAKHGCRRFHLGTKIPDTKNRRDQYVVGPTLDTLESDHFFGGIGSWLLVTRRTNTPNLHVVWTKAADFQGLSEREEQIIPRVLEGWLVSEDESIALFGMGCPVQLERSLSDAEVQYCEFWIKLDGEWREVTRWDGNNEHNRETLAEAFGCKTFDPLMITETEKDESINLGTSIAELINQYMDARCAFRVNASYRYHGMVQCRAERTLYSVFKQDWLEFPPIVSVLDPDSEEVLNIIQDSSLVSQNKLEFARLGKDKHPATEAANCFKTIGALNQEILRYPDLFASVGRRHLLPEESGRSYVAVPRGEVVCVLLNWLVLRILVLEELRGEDQFRRCLDNWREEMIELGKGRDFLRESDFHFKHAARVFEKLLDVEVELPPRITLDDDNELSLGYKIELQEESIAAEALLRETPVRFGSILAEAALGVDMKTIFSENTANLKNSSQNVSIQAAATFLCEFFSEDNSKLSRTSDFRQVPMYHHIRWKSHPTLHQAIEVFAALVNAESQTIEKDQSVNGKESEMLIHMRFRVFMLVFFSIVHDIAAKDNKNCLEKLIFDLKHITSNSVFPFSLAIPSLKTPYAVYLILPLHEERIGRILRPVVFGHVFAGRSGWDTAARAAWATPTKIKNLAEDWTSILAPIGAEVGHAAFDRLLAAHLERQYRLRSGYFIAHELNGIVNKQGTPIINRALRSGNQQLRPLRGFFNRLSSFASLACMLGDVSLALDDDHEQKKMKMKRQIQRVFIPLIELRMRYERDDVLPMLTSAVVSTVFAQATEGLKDYTVELSISPKQSGNPSAVVGSMEWESIALILGELVWNFVAHAADTGDGTGAFTSEIKGHELICRLTQFGFRQPYPEESVTFEYLGDILRMSGCGEAKYWVEDGQLIWEIVIDMSESKKRIEE